MTFSSDGPSRPPEPETRLITAGRDTKGQRGFVNSVDDLKADLERGFAALKAAA